MYCLNVIPIAYLKYLNGLVNKYIILTLTMGIIYSDVIRIQLLPHHPHSCNQFLRISANFFQ